MSKVKNSPQITIGLPSNGYIRSETAIAVAAAVLSTPDWLFKLEAPVGALVHQLREHIAQEALKAGSTHLMFIDSDIVFPPDGMAKLLECDKPIIGADYNYKFPPKRSVTNVDPRKLKPKQMVEDPLWPGHKFLSPTNRPKEPFEVRAVGMGFTLIQTSVLERIPRPWFWFDLKDGHMVGEDVWFCDRARENGISVWCDPAIQIAHIGTIRY